MTSPKLLEEECPHRPGAYFLASPGLLARYPPALVLPACFECTAVCLPRPGKVSLAGGKEIPFIKSCSM